MPGDISPDGPWQSPVQPGTMVKPPWHALTFSIARQDRWPLPPQGVNSTQVPDELAGPVPPHWQLPPQPGIWVSPAAQSPSGLLPVIRLVFSRRQQARCPAPPQVPPCAAAVGADAVQRRKAARMPLMAAGIPAIVVARKIISP